MNIRLAEAPLVRPRKIFHLHIRKCGGTSLNAALDTQMHAERTRPFRYFDNRLGEKGIHNFAASHLDERSEAFAETARESIALFDLLYGHEDITPWLTDDDYVFTVLRHPQLRVLSQFQDYRRLVPQDYVQKSQDWQRMHDACRSVADFGALHAAFADSPLFRARFEDHQCRSLLNFEVTDAAFLAMAPAERAGRAFGRLQSRCARFGVLEEIGRLLDELARDLGWCPFGPLEVLNQTKADSPNSPEVEAAARMLTLGDQILYDRVVAELQRRSFIPYSIEEFEREFAAARVLDLQPMRIGAEHVFDMNMPLIGRGLYGRDAVCTQECCRWLGVSDEALIYLPVPGPGARLTLRLYNKGWVDPALRERLTITVDGVPVRSWSESRRHVAEAICFNAVARRSWLRIGLHCDHAMTDTEAGRPSEDARRKVFNLWRYSYEIN
jgi:hypothetical protein